MYGNKVISLFIGLLLVLPTLVFFFGFDNLSNAAPPTITITSPSEDAVVSTRTIWLNYTVSGATSVNYQLLPDVSIYDMNPVALNNISIPSSSTNMEIRSYPGVEQQIIVWATNGEGTNYDIVNFSSSVASIRILVIGDIHVSYHNDTSQSHRLVSLNNSLNAMESEYPDGWDFTVQVGDYASFCSNTVPPSSNDLSDNASFWATNQCFIDHLGSLGRLYVCPGNHDFEEQEGHPGTDGTPDLWRVPTLRNWTIHYLRKAINGSLPGSGPRIGGGWGASESSNISVGLGNIRVLIPCPDSVGNRSIDESNKNMTFDFSSDWYYDEVSEYAGDNIILTVCHWGLKNSTATTVDGGRDTVTDEAEVIPTSGLSGYPDWPYTTNRFYQALRNYTVDFWIHGHIHGAYGAVTRGDGTESFHAWRYGQNYTLDYNFGDDPGVDETYILNAGGNKIPYGYGDTGAYNELWMFTFTNGSKDVEVRYLYYGYPSTTNWGYGDVPEYTNVTMAKTFILNENGTGGSPSSYNPPVVQHMGYSGCGQLDNESVMVGNFWINWTWDTNGTPGSHLIEIANDPGFSSILINYNCSHSPSGNYMNTTFSNLTASTNKRYIHIRSFYGS